MPNFFWRALHAGVASGLPVWVALTLHDTTHAALRSGEALPPLAAQLAALPGVEAVLINCCAPQVR